MRLEGNRHQRNEEGRQDTSRRRPEDGSGGHDCRPGEEGFRQAGRKGRSEVAGAPANSREWPRSFAPRRLLFRWQQAVRTGCCFSWRTDGDSRWRRQKLVRPFAVAHAGLVGRCADAGPTEFAPRGGVGANSVMSPRDAATAQGREGANPVAYFARLDLVLVDVEVAHFLLLGLAGG